MELEEEWMKNPLTRSVGIKLVKVVKALVGTNSLYGVIEQSQRKSKHLLLRSPERGLGHIIKERVPKPGIKMRELSLPPNPSFSYATFGILLRLGLVE